MINLNVLTKVAKIAIPSLIGFTGIVFAGTVFDEKGVNEAKEAKYNNLCNELDRYREEHGDEAWNKYREDLEKEEHEKWQKAQKNVFTKAKYNFEQNQPDFWNRFKKNAITNAIAIGFGSVSGYIGFKVVSTFGGFLINAQTNPIFSFKSAKLYSSTFSKSMVAILKSGKIFDKVVIFGLFSIVTSSIGSRITSSVLNGIDKILKLNVKKEKTTC